MALLFMRVMVDRSGLGAVIGLALLGCFFLLLIFRLRLPKYLLLYSSLFFLLIGYAFINAVNIHGEPFFTARGVIRYFSYFAVFILAYYSKITFKQVFWLYTIIVLIQSVLAVFQFAWEGLSVYYWSFFYFYRIMLGVGKR